MTFALALALFTIHPETLAASENLAGDRLVPLVTRGENHCSPDGLWCVSLTEREGVIVPMVRPGDSEAVAPAPAEEAFSEETFSVWPGLFLLSDGGFLAGVERRLSVGYSGGGGSSAQLRLFGEGFAPVFDQPIHGALMIRACFSEDDMEKRRGACHDEYEFTARIGMAPESEGGLPVLTYEAEAWTFPRGVRRMEDSSLLPPFEEDDLMTERDGDCSFVRRFRLDNAAGVYRPDEALPDCSAFTVP
jgi:hypothetical protein